MRIKLLLYGLLLYLPLTVRGQVLGDIDLSGLPKPTQAKGLNYWFDENNHNVLTIGQFSGLLELDVADLEDGLHTLHLQVVDDQNMPANIASRIFFKATNSLGVEDVSTSKLLYWFDNETLQRNISIMQGIQLLDVSDLQNGLHTIYFQPANSKGILGVPYSSMFIKMDNESPSATSLRYWFDDDETSVTVVDVCNGTQILNVEDLPMGLHSLNYQLIDNNGNLGIPVTRFFMKQYEKVIENNRNSIVEYQYWLNENSTSRQTVRLGSTDNPYELIALLPIQKEPLRSSLFHFDANEGNPIIYAKNEFHIRFHDAAGNWSDGSKTFNDYSNSQEVKPVGELQATQTFAKIAENDIRWYTMQAAPGDTVAFKLNQPATMQLFAPSGEEVFKTSESASVNWNGIHTWEKGTYYLAVHDVTGSQSTMKLEYMHMDKYDVVDWDVRKVGNGGCSTITFKGNGFRDLYAVDLYNAQGDTIESEAIHHENDAIVNITFDFTDKNTGFYNAVFHFTTEDKGIASILSIEEAEEISLDLDVQYPRSFLSGTSVTYTIAVTNNGNATAYSVPLELSLSSTGAFCEIESVRFTDEKGVEFNNFSLEKMNINIDSLDEETIAFFEEIIDTLDGCQNFIVVKDSIKEEEKGYTELYLTIPPQETTVLHVTLKSNSTINLHAKIPSEWITINTREKNIQRSSRIKGNSSEGGLCCYKEGVECIMDVVTNLVGLLPVGGCIDIFNYSAKTVFEIACGEGNSLGEKAAIFFVSIGTDAKQYREYAYDGVMAIISCVGGKLADKAIERLKKYKNQIERHTDELAKAQKKLENTNRRIRENHDKRTTLSNEVQKLREDANIAFNEGDRVTAAEKFAEAKQKEEEINRLYSECQSLEKDVEDLNAIISSYKAAIEGIKERIKQLRLEEIELKNNIKSIVDFIKGGIENYTGAPKCQQKWNEIISNCPPNFDGGGGSSSPYTPVDPNDIYGYLSQAGSKFITDSVAKVNYTIEFENDTAFATAAAHTIVIKDTLDKKYFVLEEFMPTGVRIGDREVFLKETEVKTQNNVTSFVKTIDMRPEINAIAQVDGTFNSLTGIAQWTFQSLDPMTMEPTNDLMQGILPVNHDGKSGIGKVMYEIGVKSGKADGAEIKNRASIVFDFEDAIITPTWTNIVDAVAPTSKISDLSLVNDTTLRITADGFDARSGVWKYEWYVQAGENAPWWKEGETDSLCFDYRVYADIDYGFCVVATDSAGNVEKKVIQRERGFRMDDQGNVDAIIDVPVDAGNDNPEAVYDLSGRKQLKPQENRINIVGKKKILYRREGQ